jgi:hypothetical protein
MNRLEIPLENDIQLEDGGQFTPSEPVVALKVGNEKRLISPAEVRSMADWMRAWLKRYAKPKRKKS